MSRYLPFAGKNAIAEMNIGIQFAVPFDQRIAEALDSIKAEFAAEFPKFEPLQMFTINLGIPQFSSGASVPAVAGFTLTKAKADGSVARALRAMNNVLSVHFLEYTSWKETKPLAIAYVKRSLQKLAILDRNSVTGILLRYIDRFTFDGPPEDATASKLFRPDNKFVALRILDRGFEWHSNSGWFEPFGGSTLALNQLNASSGAAGVVLDHNIAYTLPKPRMSIAELMEGQGQPLFAMEAILDRQHAANADLLKNLLNLEMLETIGLKG